MMNEISVFDDIKQNNHNNGDYWSARDLQKVLGYDRWENFHNVIKRAQKSFKTSQITTNYDINYHFRKVKKMIKTGKDAERSVEDYELSKYACYLIAQNGDSGKSEIALAQSYFNIQTLRQEQFQSMSDEEKRLHVRDQVRDGNKALFDSAKSSGVENFARFNDAGYRGLYGMSAKEIQKKKNLGKDKILDRAGTTELAANLFRITQTDAKLQAELRSGNVIGEKAATNTHFMVGGKVRQAIKDIGGTMPEDLLAEKDHIKKLEQKNNIVGEIE